MLLKKRRPGYRRRAFATFVFISAGVASLWALREPVAYQYAKHRERKALDRARTFLREGDLRSAALSLRVAAQTSFNDAEAIRLAADIAELSGQTEAVALREQVCGLHPDLAADRIALLRTALRFGRTDLADRTLQECNAALRGHLEIRRLEATLLLAQRRSAAAAAAWAEVLKADPTAPDARVELAALRLRDPDASQAEAARTELRELAFHHSHVGRRAARELLQDAVSHRRVTEAREHAARLARGPDATFDDVLRQLNVDRIFPGLVSNPRLAEARARVAGNPADVARLAAWMSLIGRPAEATAWLETLPPAIRETPAVRTAYAEALAMVQDWPRLTAELQQGAWGPILADTATSAMMVHSLRGRGQSEPAQKVWAELVARNSKSLADLRVLHRLAVLWRSDPDALTALKCIAHHFPEETWAMRRLAAYHFEHKNSAQLREVLARWSAAQPNDQQVRSDWLLASLLLEKGRPGTTLLRNAEKLYAHDPANPSFATLQAVAAWRQGNLRDALDIMGRLPAAELEKPGRALYYGTFLARDGQMTLARRYLQRAAKAALLPEEAALLDGACLLAASHGTAQSVSWPGAQ